MAVHQSPQGAKNVIVLLLHWQHGALREATTTYLVLQLVLQWHDMHQKLIFRASNLTRSLALAASLITLPESALILTKATMLYTKAGSLCLVDT